MEEEPGLAEFVPGGCDVLRSEPAETFGSAICFVLWLEDLVFLVFGATVTDGRRSEEMCGSRVNDGEVGKNAFLVTDERKKS
jgi:hypothetical protein